MNALTRIANKQLFNLTAGRPCRLINIADKPYLERHYLGQALGVTFYLHRFVSGDSERHVHNHPWARGCAFILAGSYTEEVATDICPASGNAAGCVTERVRRRWFNVVNAATFHRIHDAAPGTWTLFCHGKRERVGPVLAGSLTLRRLKGWGFFRTALLQSKPVSVFESYPGSTGTHVSRWWLSAPVGRDAGRLPL